MTFVTVMNQWLRDNVRALAGYGLGVVAIIMIYLPLYPQFSESGLLDAKIQALPKELIDALGLDKLLGGSGYVQTTVFGLTFVLMAIAQVSNGARAIAGEEQLGGLELTLAHAVSRPTLVLARATALMLGTIILAALVGLAVAALNQPAHLGLSWWGILAASVGLGMVVLFHGLLALAVGAATGSKGWATAVATGVAFGGYFLGSLGDLWFDWAPRLSPFYWAYGQRPMVNGFDPTGLALLALGCLAFLLIAVLGFQRRDLRV